tara:strand:+ start:444 stop:1277 length:834 start_codon:yes stop_codon:yes gene_type:complete
MSLGLSRAQQSKLDLAEARSQDLASSSTALFNVGIQEAKDDAIYKIFAENLDRFSKQALQDAQKTWGEADLGGALLDTLTKGLHLIPGLGTVSAELIGTGIEEGGRYLMGGYDDIDTSLISQLGMPDTLFKRKTVRNPLLDKQEDVIDLYGDLSDERKVTNVIAGVTDFVGDVISQSVWADTIPEGQPYSYEELVDEKQLSFKDFLKSQYIGGLPSESFYEKSLDYWKTKNPKEDDTPFLRVLYNLYPELAMSKGYNPLTDAGYLPQASNSNQGDSE